MSMASRIAKSSARSSSRSAIGFKEHSNYAITPKGLEAAQNPAPSFFAVQEIMAALPLLHKDFQGYAHYFHENNLKEAVAATFERYENRLNEIRSSSVSPSVRAASGHALVYKLSPRESLSVPTQPSVRKTLTKKA
jgi:DNA-binding IclR family transcriptional regulator